MSLNNQQKILKKLRTIPGVGPSIAQDLYDLGIRSVDDLINRNPEELYRLLCALHGEKLDRCLLYVFRCAVYFASTHNHKPELLKWWNWKD
jgi:nucleotidyltransferase/DNA polymerase involved in DNA repair